MKLGRVCLSIYLFIPRSVIKIEIISLLSRRILQLLVRLFEKPLPELEILVQLELKKTLLDRMVHLLSKGCVIPVMT